MFLAKENVLISLYPVSKSRKYNDAGVFSLDNVCFSGGNCEGRREWTLGTKRGFLFPGSSLFLPRGRKSVDTGNEVAVA